MRGYYLLREHVRLLLAEVRGITELLVEIRGRLDQLITEQRAEVKPERTELLDAKRLSTEYGFSRNTAYRVMGKVGTVDLAEAGIRKLMVRRSDLERWLRDQTGPPA